MFLNQSSSDAENGTTSGERKKIPLIDMDIIFTLLRWKHLRIIEQMESK